MSTENPNLLIGSLDQGRKPHVKARTEKGQGYPDRFLVVNGVTWETIHRASYQPEDYTAAIVLVNDRTADVTNPRLWADSVDPRQAIGAPSFPSYEGIIVTDERGRPLNPMGPTGLEGRGLLGNWGPNYAADPIVTRINEEGKIEMIVVKRKDTGEWAIPGGMVDRGERVTATLKRELGEETAAEVDFSEAIMVYQGYVDDPRNTDNAWMETDAYHLHLPTVTRIALDAGDDADQAKWMELNQENVDSLYASHSELVLRAIKVWQEQTGKRVHKDGSVV